MTVTDNPITATSKSKRARNVLSRCMRLQNYSIIGIQKGIVPSFLGTNRPVAAVTIPNCAVQQLLCGGFDGVFPLICNIYFRYQRSTPDFCPGIFWFQSQISIFSEVLIPSNLSRIFDNPLSGRSAGDCTNFPSGPMR